VPWLKPMPPLHFCDRDSVFPNLSEISNVSSNDCAFIRRNSCPQRKKGRKHTVLLAVRSHRHLLG